MNFSTTGVGLIFYFKYRENIVTDVSKKKPLFANDDFNIAKIKRNVLG